MDTRLYFRYKIRAMIFMAKCLEIFYFVIHKQDNFYLVLLLLYFPYNTLYMLRYVKAIFII